MPRLEKFNLGSLSDPSLNEKIIEFAEREAKELAELGIGILADAVKRRLSRARTLRGPATSQSDWNGRVHAPETSRAASPYRTLGIGPEASDEEVEKAFRRSVMACHPDRTGCSDDAIRRVLAAIHQIREERKP